ncbi:MAG: Crp/Fnr family transcriptional regulator [Cellulosilyticaceae bacterium]
MPTSSLSATQKLCALGTKKVLEKGVNISPDATESNALYYLEDGLCALVRYTQNGEEIIYHYFQSGQILGGVYFHLAEDPTRYLHDPYQLSHFITKTKCTLYQIPYHKVNHLIETDPSIGILIAKSMATHFHDVLGHFHGTNDHFTHVRLCKFLLNLSQKTDGIYRLARHFTYVEISKYLGVHSVTISRMMLTLKQLGIIKKDGHSTIILHPEKLVDIIQSPTTYKL